LRKIGSIRLFKLALSVYSSLVDLHWPTALPVRPRAAALLSAALAFAAPTLAFAEPEAPAAEERDEPGLGTSRPAAPDTRGGHIFVDARVGALAPAGSMATDLPTADLTGSGVSFGGILGIGISRYTVVEVGATYTALSGQSKCDACGGRIFDLGIGLSYHLAQGIAVDPWISYGVGLRMTELQTLPMVGVEMGVESGALLDQSYRGIDLARFALGADFYPTPKLGFGPYLQLDLGTNFARPDFTTGSATYAFFQVGLRIALDPLRKPLTPTPAQSALASWYAGF